MKAIDCNVLVQFLTHDDDGQWPKAERQLRADTEIPDTVLLETEWILRAVYRLRPADIGRAFEALLSTKTVHVRDRARANEALRLYREGLDFADAMHAAMTTSTSLRTFDKRFVKQARAAKARTSVDGV